MATSNKKPQKVIYELCSMCIVKNALLGERTQPYSYREYARKAFMGEIRRTLAMGGLAKVKPYHVSDDAYGYEDPGEGTHVAVWIREVKI